MGGQIDIRADAAIARMAGAALGCGLATLIRRLAAGYHGQRPAGLIVGCICVCAGELPQAGVRSGLFPATEGPPFQMSPVRCRPLQGPGGTRAADAAGRLVFPDVPRLELDQLLVELVDRADDVLAARGRLRGPVRHLVRGSARSCWEYPRCLRP